MDNNGLLLKENTRTYPKHWEWFTFLGCVIVLKNRKQATAAEYVTLACLFAKALNIILFYETNVLYAFMYCIFCLLHFVFLPRPVYKGPEFITYFRGPHLKNEIARDKRITWVVCFYAAWSPSCVSVAPIFSEISAEYHLENLQFGKIDVSRYSDVADHFKVSNSSFSKQLPTLIVFQDGKEKMRRPAVSAKGTVVKYVFTKENIVKDFEINELYHQCRQSLPKSKTANSEAEKKKN
ncbi:thioredoxin-related transmembrane protein 2 homolog isoform X2 [Dreissena polymorpha]|uniref:thioredoxin-related transmembrane protein 2 homolog isoform X2 n=1 Tax=Dreissena polymorpha TaxID=45954 RepID=UPI00226483AB|nr:thioredoxin-related transmembrane protein 2 homolog isoform X2 [Dreissena polymorpha]